MSYRTFLPDVVPEGTSARLTAVFRDDAGDPIGLSRFETLTLTLYDRASEAVINGHDKQDVLNANGGVLDEAGLVVMDLGVSDNVILNAEVKAEQHVALFEYQYDSGRRGKSELAFLVGNLTLVP
jgi:hypothetical protein